jgi:hypothetical protein
MNILNKLMLNGLVGFVITTTAVSAMARGGRMGPASTDITLTTDSTVIMDGLLLDTNEQAHLTFMREEEKLARDVYIKLGDMYPDHPIFGRIDDSEQTHTDAVKAMIEKYGLKDPNTNDNIGVYTGEDYGWYFTEKFNLLVERASISELEALYVGAFIEELDMMDINNCPQVIVDTENQINDTTECGKIYTDNADVSNLYASLLDGSSSHLEGYVKNIEKYIGEGNYQAQVLTQEQVDEILER